jgi:AcrR family transcriptional regulator
MSPPRPPSAPTRRRRKPEVAEREILDAAVTFLSDHEFRELSVDALMRGTGMRRSTFYDYFDDRAAVVLRLLDESQIAMLAPAQPWLTGGFDDPVAALAEAIRGSTDAWLRHSAVLRAVHRGAAQEPAIDQRYQSMIDEWAGLVAQRLRAEHRASRTTITRPDTIAAALILTNVSTLSAQQGAISGRRRQNLLADLIRIWTGTIYPGALTEAA